MSNSSVTSTLYFEATGSGGSGAQVHGVSGQTNRFLPLTSSGSVIPHMAIAGTLSAPTSVMLIRDPNSMEVVAVLPTPTGHWYGGTTLALTLPKVTASIAGTILGSVRIAGTLPVPLVAIDALSGALMEIDATLPMITGVNDFGIWDTGRGFSDLQLPLPVVQIQIGTAERLAHAGRLPAVEAAISITTGDGRTLRLDLILPAVVGATGPLGVAAILPTVRGSLFVTAGSVAERITWVMNIEHNAVTEFDNFEFKQYARAFNRYWATGMDGGLFLLGGDRDLTAPIAWSFETGISDLGTRGLKGMLGAYLDGIFERHLEFTVVADRGRYVYNHTVSGRTDQENHQTQRVSLGRGIRTANVGFGLASKRGAYFEMDSITPDYVVSNRNLG